MNAPIPPGRKVAKPRTRRPGKPPAAKTPTPGAGEAQAAPSVPASLPDTPPLQQPERKELTEPLPPSPSEPPKAEALAADPPPAEIPREERPRPSSAPDAGAVAAPPPAARQERREEHRGERRQARDVRREEHRGEGNGRDGRRQEPRQERREERREDSPARRDEPERPRPQEMGPQTRGLTLLGAKTTVYSDRYTPAVLEAFENRHPENDYFVKFNCPEFTSLCPITGQPDFATLHISYIPDRRMVESKSLKLYLFGFRNHGAFHEDCVNTIMKDLIKLMAPRYIEVWGRFLPRGGLSIDPYANYGRPTTRWEEFARQRLLMHDLTPERVDNR